MPRPAPIWLALLVLLLLWVQPGPALAAPQACPVDMVAIPAGRFRIGAAGQLDEERATGGIRLSPFCLAAHEVTNRQFATFVAATGYRTVAERPLSVEQFPQLKASERAPGSLVFRPVAGDGPIEELSWWNWVPGADWRHPQGPASSIAGLEEHPVVQVAFEDAEAFAAWAGAALPSEAQWEFAARGGLKDQVFSWGNTWKPGLANTWQGEFPRRNDGEDGFVGTAPVGSFPPNGYGLLDMTGNVWEWTADWYLPGHEGLAQRSDPAIASEASSNDPRDPGVAKHVIKGGSFLCSPTYCSRYRPAAREAQSPDTGTSHIGFRLVAPLS
ncbi:formylglycine-generating enzyme family protein [Synechococcus sp. RedBA-s]|uniref:formylglycine-generating enzyme family protein n=1 Tax=Synechococcus sp. RedBA-s TaxID=2823741 RepID=UPI0020CC7772|nr:formylglycine-generating enzyme family protein [Synechococcus sp. RedBA-s]MCP9800290.1 formylglycine-generating enzyme family protein [Synechococcus sp. RedBA-s]